jgi:dipeptidyl aminopeptidase/acylaminoacyl peptidase
LTIADARGPAEVWTWDAEAGLRQLSHHNAALLSDLDLPAPQRHTFRTADGPPCQGWLLVPAGDGPFPLVLSVHGGPHNFFGDTWSFDHQLYAAEGYAVLYVNPRGSGGYGEAFAGQVVADWGGGDFADQLAALDAVLAGDDPRIDAKRLAIAGSSYGGFMTCWAVGQTDRFAAAVSGACISNLTSFFGTSDIGATWAMREFGGPPHERLDWYLAHSPIRHVDKVTTPLLLYHGEDDLRCPIEQSEQMFSALHQLGKTVELLRLPGEAHAALSAGSPSHRLDGRRAILEWLARYLAPRDSSSRSPLPLGES